LMAAQGYVVVAPNRRGLPGFGRAWNDEISKDWGGQAMQDILAVTDDVATEPFVDSKKMAGIGASFGGYTAYWMMGNGADRFAAMISHAGLFNLESMYGVTEELFFVNWDVGGPYWRSKKLQDSYNRFSPHRFVGNWKTPLLVIHGEKDFRVPIGEGMQAFTAAQLQGVPSRFLYFPEEGHWVQNPQNGVLWHRVFFDWLARYCKN
jgi:dipeptidyl aminopeptidase/acylaminoacyl peptidase